MSYSAKPRLAVDLDEIARQLNEPRPAPAQPSASTGRGDPLSELARIVGQEDPYKGMLGPVPSGAPRGARSDIQFPPGPVAEDRQAEPYEPGYEDEAYEDTYPSEDQEDLLPLEPRRSRKGLIAVAGVLGVAVLGVGGALVFGGGSGFVPAGEPPVIAAADGPVKVEPQAPGGVEIPNQNKQIYERAAADTQTRIVNREEQPVDVRQAVRAVATNPEPVAAPQGPGPVQNALAATLGEPRRVRTVAIRPDGTVVSDASPGGAPAPTQSASPSLQQTQPAPQRNVMPTLTLPPAAAAPTPAAPTAAPAPAPVVAAPAPAPVAAPAPVPAAAIPAPATPVAAAPPTTPRPTASTPSSPAPATPAPQPTATPAPARVAAVSPNAPMSITPGANATPTPAPAAPVAGGGWAVQLGVRPSEGEARTAFTQFQQKHAELKGQAPIIRQAEVNGNTLYRVRVGPLSRDEASALCSKLQGSGGQCFVAKN